MSTSYCALNPGVSPGARTPKISSSDISAWSSRIFLIPTSSFTQAVVFFLYKLQRGLRSRVMAWVLRPAVVGDATDSHLVAVVPRKNFVLKHFNKQRWKVFRQLLDIHRTGAKTNFPFWYWTFGEELNSSVCVDNLPQSFDILIVAIIVSQEECAQRLATVSTDNFVIKDFLIPRTTHLVLFLNSLL